MIKNIDKIYQVAKNWKPLNLAFIKKIEWSDGNLKIAFLSQIRNDTKGRPDTTNDFFEVLIIFNGIADFTFKSPGSKLHQLSGFDIVDISKNGWERINYHIEDYENGKINFYCKEVII